MEKILFFRSRCNPKDPLAILPPVPDYSNPAIASRLDGALGPAAAGLSRRPVLPGKLSHLVGRLCQSLIANRL
jgi:hypothetical protein